jgi:hypothetical protein
MCERTSKSHSLDLLFTIYEADRTMRNAFFFFVYAFFIREIDEMRYKRHHQRLIPSVSVYVYGSLTKICKRKNEKKPIRRTWAYLRRRLSYHYPLRVCVCVCQKEKLLDDENTLRHPTHA